MLLLLTLGAFAMPILSERIGWFAAPCEVLYGALVANFVPGANDPGAFVGALSSFGFLLLLFLAGLELDFSLLTRLGPRILLRAAAASVGIQLIALLLGLLLRWPVVQILLVGALSVSLLLVVLRQAGLSQSVFGQTILIIAAVGEFISILMLTSFDLILRHGLGWPLAIEGLKLIVVLVLGYLALRLLRYAVTRRPRGFRRLFAHADPSEIGVRAALALMMCFAALAVLLGVEQILATFVAGVVCSFTFRGGNRLFDKLSTFGQGFFVPIFFITTGLGFHLRDLLTGPALAYFLGILVATLAIRLLAIPLLRFAGLAWTEAAAGACLLAAPLTLQVAIVQVGIATGQVSGHTQGIVLGATILGAILFPLLGRSLLPDVRASVRGRAHALATRRRARLRA